jgi:beta-mannosidase
VRRQTVSLGGDWERRDFIDEAWRWSDAVRRAEPNPDGGPPAKAAVSAGWRAGRVPGSTLDDAWRAGEIPDPYVDRASMAAEWIPQRTWLYRRRFTVPADGPPNAALRFEGIDPGGAVLLDGAEVARHTGMFVPLTVELGELRAGDHELVVALDPAPVMPSQVSRTELVRLHRSRMGYGWDFCPRMIQTGIWRSVSLDRYEARLVDLSARVEADAAGRSAAVVATAAVRGTAESVVAQVVGPDGSVVAEQRSEVDGAQVRIELELDRPSLWWPNGLGPPSLHRLILRLMGPGLLDERELRLGVRSLSLAPTEVAEPGARPYTLVVNGRPTWIRGWNWVPMDAAYGVPRPDRLRHLVELARRAHVNLLRVWGGGLIESAAFYDACDAAGILVWQEFAQSSSGVSNTPASDGAFVDLMRSEAEVIVPSLTHHPSLAIWCGGNELADDGGHPLDDAHPVLAALREVVDRLDPGRPWLPTSPSGPRFDNSLAAVGEDPASLHDVHGPWEHQGLTEQHALANATTSLLHSEFGVEGMTNLASLRATISEPARWSAGRDDPVLAHRGAWWNNEPFVQRAFGGALSLEELERASQHLQADGLRTLVEGDRRRWPRNAGALPWVFNEPFPNAWSNAAVDYFGTPKAGYHAVADAYRPILPGASFDRQALDGAEQLIVTPWIVNDTPDALAGPMTVTLSDATGRCLDRHQLEVTAAANAVATADAVTLQLPPGAADLLVLDVAVDEHRSRRLLSRTATLEPIRRLPPADLHVTVSASEDRWVVALAVGGDVAAVEMRLVDARPVGWPERVGAPHVEPNVVTLLPGEEIAVSVDWQDVPAPERHVLLSGWNVGERGVSP